MFEIATKKDETNDKNNKKKKLTFFLEKDR